jgi:hypothetical protein
MVLVAIEQSAGVGWMTVCGPVGDEDAAFRAVSDADAEVVHAGGSSEADHPAAPTWSRRIR